MSFEKESEAPSLQARHPCCEATKGGPQGGPQGVGVSLIQLGSIIVAVLSAQQN